MSWSSRDSLPSMPKPGGRGSGEASTFGVDGSWSVRGCAHSQSRRTRSSSRGGRRRESSTVVSFVVSRATKSVGRQGAVQLVDAVVAVRDPVARLLRQYVCPPTRPASSLACPIHRRSRSKRHSGGMGMLATRGLQKVGANTVDSEQCCDKQAPASVAAAITFVGRSKRPDRATLRWRGTRFWSEPSTLQSSEVEHG